VQTSADWGLDRISPPMDTQYSYIYTGMGVKIFVLDTGILTTHIEFGTRASCPFTACPGTCNDIHGHGTHVAGIAGGTTYGVAKDVMLVGVKVLCTPSGSWAGVISGINYVIGQKKQTPKIPMVINMSLGGPFNTLLNTAVSSAYDAGIVVVVSAGNNDVNACSKSPASATNAITVGASDRKYKKWFIFWRWWDVRASFSNWGTCVDIFAPGVNIRSASILTTTSSTLKSGTSMASPFVAGVAALQLQKLSSPPPPLIGSIWAAIQADSILNQMCNWLGALGSGSPNRFLVKGNTL
jgi:aqualysin 1